MENIVTFRVISRMALFSDPITRIGGEKSTYMVPTYQALKGIAESIYWKPSFIWEIDECRVMKPIKMQSRSIKTKNYKTGKTDLFYYMFLSDVEYEVKAHIRFNTHRKDLLDDFNMTKHLSIAQRMVQKGGRRDIFLGLRKCQGYVLPVEYGSTPGAYDQMEYLDFGMMFHGFNYADETGKNLFQSRFWQATMQHGVIKFIKPQECSLVRDIRAYQAKEFSCEEVRS